MAGLVLDAKDSSRFELLSPLGRGGFGAVFEARDRHSGLRVALKELGQASGDNLARFKQEFRALSGLHHPNLVGLKELFELDGRWFIVMELVAGTDFLQYVRSPHAQPGAPAFDERRLRTALAGMAQGLCALHEFGVLHRDLKPSNVFVTHEGRAVLLDFGLVTSTDPMRQSTQGAALGTVAYMAPEQAVGHKIGPAADWYALGGCLFEALTGRLPFEGSSGLALLLAKQQRAAPRASLCAAHVPADLDALCARLLAQDPDERPTGAEVLGALGVQRGDGAADADGVLAAPVASAATFAGRELELENLERARLRTHDGEFRLVLVEGESGVGKSELVAEFLRGLRRRHATLVTLQGRCYENEQLPYKAFDGCVDELAKLLRRLSAEECRALMPLRAALLGQLFPVLSHVPCIAKARRDQLSADPSARRLEAFGALAQLLGKLAEDRPVVLVIDDLQWADAESFRLLKALVDQSERPPVLIVATIRPREELEPEILAQVERVRAWPCTDVQPLYGLPAHKAESLAANLLGPLADGHWIRSITEESRGHPLFLSELVHFARSREIGTAGVITLDAAVQARIERLSRSSRELLELVAVAARPYGSQVFARALRADVEHAARPLLSAKVLRARKGDELGCYHDRLRQVALSLIPKARLPQLHRQLAAALADESGIDRAELARHWDLAGEAERAADAYEEAAIMAMSALAFGRAAELGGRALTLIEDRRDERYVRLLSQRADALACAGRSAQAAALYARAADLECGDTRIRLRGHVANQLLLSAQVGPGLRAAREVLAEVGVGLPLATGRALLRFAWERVSHALFSRFVRLRGEERARRRLAVELVGSLNRSIGFVDPAAYLALTAQYVRLAASLGDEAQVALAYAAHGYLNSLRGSIERGAAQFDRARALCERLGQPKVSAIQTLLEGTARMVGWDIDGAEACVNRAHELLQAHCPEKPRELTQARTQLGASWYLLGKHAQLASEAERWLAEAREREDSLAVAMLLGLGYGSLRHLMRGDPEAAVRELDEAVARIPAEPFGFAHLGHMLARQVALFYQGGPAALRWLQERLQEWGRPFLLRTPFGRETYLLCALTATLHAAQSASGREHEQLLRAARKHGEELGRRKKGIGRAYAQLGLAQLDALAGELETAKARLHDLRKHAGGLETTLGQQSWFLEGVLERSPAGESKCAEALAFFKRAGWKQPERAVALNLPLLPRLSRPRASEAGPGLLIDRYQVLTRLARGGFGSVVEARDTHTGTRVALKEFAGIGAKPLERFKQEFRALQGVHHPNLVRLHALFEHEGAWYIAMELLEGQDLLSYVRPEGRCDLGRLRQAFAGVAQALSALHEAGFAHRDLTPSNVCVTATGRPVLLDFGLIGRLDAQHESAQLGTPDYAAPEQLEGAHTRAAADVYALGACLYHALAGVLPHQAETPLSALRLKQRAAPTGEGLQKTPELALCLRMLDPRPSSRPTLAEVIAALSTGERPFSVITGLHTAPAAPGPGFWGRADELTQLESALERAAARQPAAVLLAGESGVGKSALVAEFTSRAQASRPEVLVLSSRCYENEQVTLKALDGAIDQLARALSRLPGPECEQLLPRRAGLLTQLFPVLLSVPAFAAAGKKGIPADPAARRLAAYDCCIQFLLRLGERFTLVLVVDDLQWADAESFRALRQLLDQRGELPLLLVCTMRPQPEVDPQVAREIEALMALPSARRIELAGLSSEDAGELAAQLVADGAPRALLDKLVQESRGHPLFLRELVEHAKVGTLSQTAPSLDEAIRARVERLDEDARAILDLVALAARPCRAEWLARALGVEALPREALSTLLAQGLVRARGEREVSCYHDRIRRAVEQLYAGAKQKELAAKLAAALQSDGRVDPAERARLWDLAGDATLASAAHEQAGDHALEGLSFARAEAHYARALTLFGERRDEAFVRVAVQRGHALARMGNSADAARVFQHAAAYAPLEMQTRLRIWAAQHLILGAQAEQGLSAAAVLLRELGLPIATSDRAALVRVAWERAQVAVRGTRLRARKRELTHSQRLVLDALHGLSSPVRAASYLPGSVLVVQYLRRALSAGDPSHTARALAYEGMWRGVAAKAGSKDEALFDRSRELADSSGDAAVVAEVELARGLVRLARCQFPAAAEMLSYAHELLHSRCPGQPWLLTAARMYQGNAWMYMGSYRSIAQHSAAWLAEAKAKQDRYAVAALAGFGAASLTHLLNDDADAALDEIESAMAPWPAQPFSTHHFGAFAAGLAAHAYRSDGYLPWQESFEARSGNAFLMRTPACRVLVLSSRVFALLSCALGEREARVQELVSLADAATRELTKVPSVIALGLAELQSATLSALRGAPEEALGHARTAQTRLRDTLFAHGARHLEGMLLAGSEGRGKCQQTLAWLEGQGFCNPRRALRIILPGAELLAARLG